MEIHKPKPWHGWRDFLKEYAIIVIGVLTALAAEQTAEGFHERHAAAEAREAVYTEIRQNMVAIQGRAVTQNCVERRLDEIGALIAQAGDGPLLPHPSWVGQPSIWLMATQRWQAATGSGRTSLFDSEQQGRLADVYVATSQFAEAEATEQAAWAQLRGLESWTGPLGPAGRIHFLSALQEARYELWNTRISMELALQRARELGVASGSLKTPWPSVPPGGGTAKAGTSIPHAVCLPIDTPRDQALKLLSIDSPPWGQPK